MLLFIVILSIPLVSLYFGYVIGHTMGNKPRHWSINEMVVLNHTHLNKSMVYTHFLTTDLYGGLGTMMFKYASLYGIAKVNAMFPVVSDDNYLTTVFPCLYSETSQEDREGSKYWASFREKYSAVFDRRSFSLNYQRNLKLQGFFQSWRYFDNMRQELLQQFCFSPETQEEAEAFIMHSWKSSPYNSMPLENVTFVGVHVRRGEFLDSYNLQQGYNVADIFYIKRAMQYYMNLYPNVIFIATSDDKRWTKIYVRSKHASVFVPGRGPASLDLAILTQCNHSIMTVGNFGWWASYLAGGDTVYFKGFPILGSTLSHSFNHKDFYPPKWIGL